MTRKDNEKETERPHYYSQFWLDVAAGRRVIGTPIGAQTEPRLDEAEDAVEIEPAELEPIALRKVGHRATAADTDGYRETRSQAVVEPAPAPEEEDIDLAPEEFDLANEVDDLDIPNILVDDTDENANLTEIDELPPEEPEEEAESFFDEEEEEEEDSDWEIGRGRKKPKPGRQVKQPKKPKRDTRRGF